ncbi:MAG: hypothetical protein ACP5D2_01495 [Candidatus Nanoarchaeia archaeon]
MKNLKSLIQDTWPLILLTGIGASSLICYSSSSTYRTYKQSASQTSQPTSQPSTQPYQTTQPCQQTRENNYKHNMLRD